MCLEFSRSLRLWRLPPNAVLMELEQYLGEFACQLQKSLGYFSEIKFMRGVLIMLRR